VRETLLGRARAPGDNRQVAPFESESVAWMRHAHARVVATIAFLAAGPLVLAYGLAAPGYALSTVFALVFGPAGALMGAVTAVHLWRRMPPTRRTKGSLRADEEGVRWNGRLAIPLTSIRSGFLVPPQAWGRPPLVRIERRWPRAAVTFEVPDVGAARALLRALGLDGSQVVASFAFRSRVRASGWGPMVTLALIGAPFVVPFVLVRLDLPREAMFAFAAVELLALVVWLVLNAMPIRAEVGADGVLVSWLWRRRFVSYDRIRGIGPYGAGDAIGVEITLDAGTPLRLPIAQTMSPAFNREQLGLVVQRLLQAAAGHRAAHQRPVPVLPEAGGRSTSEWVRSLRAVGTGANADHRTAPVDVEQLWRIVEDPGKPQVARASAAVALSGGLDEAARARLLISARATAAPEMRRLLEVAAEDASEDEIGAMLERVSRAGQ
jgi:hypothetical protein